MNNDNTENIDRIKSFCLEVCQKHSIKRASLFGSFARQEATDSSDIDLLVEFQEGKSLFDLIDLKNDLEKISKRKVDVVTYASLHPLIKEKVMAEQEIII